jgi:hypothetical protein
MQSAVFIIACMLCRADRSFRMRTCHFAALLIFLTKVSFEASKFASYYPSCFVVRVVAALFDFLLLKFVVPNMKRKSIFVGLSMRDYHSNFIPSCLTAYFVCIIC